LPQIATIARGRPLLTAVFALLVLWLVNRSLHEQLYADQGLYYLNSIRWTTDYAIVPGLGNLHTRLAFNNSSFLLHAMLEVAVGRGHSAHVLNGLMAAISLPIVFSGFACVFRENAGDRQVGWYVLALAMLVAIAAFDGRIYSATPDLPTSLFVTVAAWRLLALAGSESESTGPNLRWNLLAIALLATAAVVVKVMVVFFAMLAALVLVAIVYLLNRNRSECPLADTLRSVAFMAIWSILLFVPWIVRGYVFSGYPVYPSTFAGAPVDWKLDAQETTQLRELYRIWFRAYDQKNYQAAIYQDGWAWVPEWIVQAILIRAPLDVMLPVLIAVASMLWLGWRTYVRPGSSERASDANGSIKSASSSLVPFCGWLLAAAYVGALVAWFLMAPGARFATFATWGLAGVCVGLASRTIPVAWTIRYRWLILAALAAMALLPMFDQALRIEVRYRHNPNHFFYQRRFYQSYPFVLPTGRGGFPPVPKAELEVKTTKSGLRVYVPAPRPGDEQHEMVWDSPVPASDYFEPDLEMRRPGELQSGFRIARPTASISAESQSP
jgi:hypothetical protein